MLCSQFNVSMDRKPQCDLFDDKIAVGFLCQEKHQLNLKERHKNVSFSELIQFSALVLSCVGFFL